jgi:hypothetical protein
LIDQQTIVSTRRCDMFSKTIRMKPSDGEALIVGKGLRACLGASALALACVTVAGPAVAQSRFDGTWSVVIVTRGGACQSGLRYGVQIVNGQVIGGGGGADVRGRVGPGGGVAVSVSAGGQSASGSGHLNMMSGGGVWRGQGNAGYCQGTWVAQRSGYGAQAMEGPGPVQRPLYNYAPRYYLPPGGGYYGPPGGQY